MADSPHNPPPKVTLEHLLRLKRHERPAPEFWARFDRELRERALRALVQPAPVGWRWSRVLLSRVLPWTTAGATAALALAFLWHEPASPTAHPSVAPQAVAVSASVGAADGHAAVETPAHSVASSPAAPVASIETMAPGVQPTYVVTALSDGAAPSSYRKVSATVAFHSGRQDGVHYAAATLANDAVPARAGGWKY